MPGPNTPASDAAEARRCLARSDTAEPMPLAQLAALQAIASALLAVAGHLENLAGGRSYQPPRLHPDEEPF